MFYGLKIFTGKNETNATTKGGYLSTGSLIDKNNDYSWFNTKNVIRLIH